MLCLFPGFAQLRRGQSRQVWLVDNRCVRIMGTGDIIAHYLRGEKVTETD